MSHPW